MAIGRIMMWTNSLLFLRCQGNVTGAETLVTGEDTGEERKERGFLSSSPQSPKSARRLS